MNTGNSKLIYLSSKVILLALFLTSCSRPSTPNPPTPASPTSDEPSNIQVEPAEAVTTLMDEDLSLQNCEGTKDLVRTLSSQTSVRKSVAVGSKATAGGEAEVGVSAVAKAKLQAAIELAYQQVYETAVSRVDTIVMAAAPASYIIHTVEWEEQKFHSSVSYDVAGKTFTTDYEYKVAIPTNVTAHQVGCPITEIASPTPLPNEPSPTPEPPTPETTPVTSIPTPELTLTNSTLTNIRGKNFVLYEMSIENWEKFPAELFTPAPDLPPCGKNTNSARTWVEIHNAEDDSYIYGFCALGSPEDLGSLSFAVEEGVTPPAAVYVVLVDRQENVSYRSNTIPIQ